MAVLQTTDRARARPESLLTKRRVTPRKPNALLQRKTRAMAREEETETNQALEAATTPKEDTRAEGRWSVHDSLTSGSD